MASRIQRNDRVVIIAGKDKGKQARVLRVLADRDRVLVEGVGMMKRHVKPNPQRNVAGGIVEQESPIHVSNVMLLDSEGKPTRVGFRIEDGKKVRVARSNGSVIPNAAR